MTESNRSPLGPDQYRLGRALADVVAEYANLDPQSIHSISADSDQIEIRYGVRTSPHAIRGRVRVMDARTSTSLTDNWED
jgi:hypothetical protein